MAQRLRTGESGFTLLAFMMTLAIMSIMMGVAVQAVSFQMQREREMELIFRGEQYVEAIRLYKAKYGRYPMRLKEMWEAEPKVLRRKWTDPMTDSLQWALIFEGDLSARGNNMRGSQVAGGGGFHGGGPVPTGTPTFGTDDRDDGEEGTPVFPVAGDGTDGETGNPTRMGPIIGVHTTECGESIKEYDARTDHCEWKFIYRERQQGQTGGSNVRARPPGSNDKPGEDDGSDKDPQDLNDRGRPRVDRLDRGDRSRPGTTPTPNP